MYNKKYYFAITLLFYVWQISESTNNTTKLGSVEFKPSLWIPNNVTQRIELKCCFISNNISINNQTINFEIKYENNNISRKYEFDFKNDSYSYKIFNYTFDEWQSLFKIKQDFFPLRCNALLNGQIVNSDYTKIEFKSGQEYGQNCSVEMPCNSDYNLECDSKCKCLYNYVPIQTDSKTKCYPMVSMNESCVFDKQCEVEDSVCKANAVDNRTCQCKDYYKYNGTLCESISWCYWFDYDWISMHWIDVIVILIAFSTGLCLLLIVLSISFYLRLRARKTGNNPLAFRYPSSFMPKIVVSNYFSHKDSDDKKDLTSNDYLSKN